MCYRIVIHSMRCDVRPLLSDGDRIYVDAYAKPLECDCKQEKQIRPWLRCEEHGCCMRTAKMYRCGSGDDAVACGQEPLEYHEYEQAHIRTFEKDEEHFFGLAAKKRHPWADIPAVDDLLWPLPGMAPLDSEASRLALANLLVVGHLILENVLTMQMLVADKDGARAAHHERHGRECERVLNPWECDDLDEIDTMEVLTGMFKLVRARQIELFGECRKVLSAVSEEDLGGRYVDLMVDGMDVVRDE